MLTAGGFAFMSSALGYYVRAYDEFTGRVPDELPGPRWRMSEGCVAGRVPLCRAVLPVTWACAPVAQLDRAPDYESGGRRFESFRARHFPQ